MKRICLLIFLIVCFKSYAQISNSSNTSTVQVDFYDRSKIALLAGQYDYYKEKEARLNCDNSVIAHSDMLDEIKNKITPAMDGVLVHREKYLKEIDNIIKASEKSVRKCGSPRYAQLRQNVNVKLNKLYAEIISKK